MLITKEKLQNIVDGKISKSEINEPFLVVRDIIRIPFLEYVSYGYYVIFDNKIKREFQKEVIANEIEIDRQLAIKLIKKYNMEITLEEKGTRFYEVPGRPYQNKYKGKDMLYI